jgi:hypothetical protein
MSVTDPHDAHLDYFRMADHLEVVVSRPEFPRAVTRY